MFVAVAVVRATLSQHGVPGALSLAIQIVCGGLVYLTTAFVLAGANVRELLRIVRPARQHDSAHGDGEAS
jgi:hypothetical protein